MIMKYNYDIYNEPRESLYDAFVLFCCRYSVTGMLVYRRKEELSVEGLLTLQSLMNCGALLSTTSRWPGTVLGSGVPLYNACVFNLTKSALTVIRTAVTGLYDWIGPYQLEDLALLRSDGTRLLASISHERCSTITLSNDEYLSLRDNVALYNSLMLRRDSDHTHVNTTCYA